jgi:hypothetical protein
MTETRNPIALVAPGESGMVSLARDVTAFVARGEEPGPIVWVWAPRGERDPSHAQALSELRDRLSPQGLRGAVGLLVDGPPPPLLHESYAWTPAVRALAQDADAVVLLSSLPVGWEAAAHVTLDPSSTRARKVARALGASVLAPEGAMAALNHALVGPAAVTWLDGESERLSRQVIDRAAAALGSLLGTFGMSDDPPLSPEVRVMLKAVATVDAEGGGLVEPVVAPGELVLKGQPVAYAGAPGTRTRRTLRAPANGVVLWLRSGQVLGGDVMGIGKLRRALPRMQAARRRDGERTTDGERLDLGWCEQVTLPELGVKVRAKIDTGARSCALHVTSMREVAFDDDGHVLMDLTLPDERGRSRAMRVMVLEYAHVKDSGGHTERRPVIETLLQMGGRAWRVRVTLTDRGDMRFAMLVGRTALTADMRVHPTRRYLTGR